LESTAARVIGLGCCAGLLLKGVVAGFGLSRSVVVRLSSLVGMSAFLFSTKIMCAHISVPVQLP
jgi:hypothetical protein